MEGDSEDLYSYEFNEEFIVNAGFTEKTKSLFKKGK